MWRNRQTRRIQVPVVVNTLWVQVPSSAPNKHDGFDTKPSCFYCIKLTVLKLKFGDLNLPVHNTPYNHNETFAL